jgi:DTW domain-containing protein YfiP
MRSVVRHVSRRCPRCQLATRWCICPAHQEITCPLAIDVLTHHRERFRPSSTGTLINRIVPASRHILWRRERQLTAAEVQMPGRELWILHPHGDPLPSPLPAAGAVQVLLLDGSWRESSAMGQEVRGWGPLVSLSMAGASRYWLRAQADAARFSTVETLLFLLRTFGLEDTHQALRLQFELHVYASLRARGQKKASAEFLADSPIREAFRDLIAQLDVRRPQEDL